MERCWRCGVDWDKEPSYHKPDAPCPDCQEDTPGDWTWGNKHAKRIDKEKLKALCAPGILSDDEVAKQLGCTAQTVYRWRKKLDIPPTMTPAWEFIKDKGAAREQARRAWLDSPKPKEQKTKGGTPVPGTLGNHELDRLRIERHFSWSKNYQPYEKRYTHKHG